MSIARPILDALHSQRFDPGDIAIIGILIALEGLLSIDNALVLGLLARRLPVEQRRSALTYGLGGALVFRLIAVAAASWLMQSRIVMLLGGIYLLYLSLRHFVPGKRSPQGNIIVASGRPVRLEAHPGGSSRFWPTVLVIELTDIAVAVDSILAAIAMVTQGSPGITGVPPKLWLVMVGGMLGVILMRIAAVAFIKLLEIFPRFESSAYWLVFIIGFKLILIWRFNIPGYPPRLDFHNVAAWPFWTFWSLMAAAFCAGFFPQKKTAKAMDGII